MFLCIIDSDLISKNLIFINTKLDLKLKISIKFRKLLKQKKVPYKRKKQFNTIKYFFKFGDKALFSDFQYRIERIYFKIIKKIIKKKYKKKKKKTKIHNRYWIRFSLNLFLTKKSKNARMGSGKGKYVRSAFLIKKNQSLLEFKNFDYYYISILKLKIYYKLNINLTLLSNSFKIFSVS